MVWCWVQADSPELREKLQGKLTLAKQAKAAGGSIADITVTTATDGNHGRSVAWGAQMFGCRCIIYINEAVSKGREAAIAAFGAEVQRNPGSFDDAVRQTRETAAQEGWHVIPDTSAGATSASPFHPRL